MSRVNPPPQRKIPAKIFDDPELRGYFQDLEFNFFQLWKRTGGGDDLVQDALLKQASKAAQLDALTIEVRGGDALTSDETGFTVDSTKLTVDMTEA